MRTNTWIALSVIAAIGLTAGASTGGAQKDPGAAAQLQAAINKETVEGDLKAAIELYRKLADSGDHAVAANALVRLGQCYEKLGNTEATKAYERVVREFSDQKEMVAAARARLAAMDRGSGSTQGITVRQVWSGPWYGGLGAPSRDGAYVTFRTHGGDLAIRDLATAKIRQLTTHQSPQQEAYQSVPSPDGRQVAYCWYNDGRNEVRVVGLDGSDLRVLYKNSEVDAYPTDWSPDRESILAVLDRADKTHQIALLSLRDGSARVLKDTGDRWVGRPRFSPDGRYVAYALQQDPKTGENDIFVLPLDGGPEVPVVEHSANDVDAEWTPDGLKILFLSNRTGKMGAWRISVTKGVPQGSPELIKPDLGENIRAMGFAGKGSYYYGLHTEMSEVYVAELDLGTGQLVSAPVPATERFVGTHSKPDWSPDGRQMLFLSKRGPGYWGARAFCVRSTESGEVRELAVKLDRMPGARWLPDGRSLIGMANHPTDGIGLYRIDVQTGDCVAVPRPPGHYGYLVYRDVKSMFYMGAGKEPKEYCVLLRDLETGRNRELYCFNDPAQFASRLTLSPDGSQLAFVMNEVGSIALKVVPAAGGEARDVLRGARIPYCEAPIAWAPDGESLLFLRQPEDRNAKTELWLVPVQGGEPRRLGLAAEGMTDIVLHPDGRHIAFTTVQDRDEIWALENFLPAPGATKR